jgi:hypothetical protein
MKSLEGMITREQGVLLDIATGEILALSPITDGLDF